LADLKIESTLAWIRRTLESMPDERKTASFAVSEQREEDDGKPAGD
jgi:hypothetical protein